MTKQVIKTIVVDDEPLARKGLRARLERHDDVQVLAEVARTETAHSHDRFRNCL